MPDVTIYTKSGCPYCAAAKADFQKRGMKFKEISVPNTPGALEEMLKLNNNQRRVPTIVQSDKVTIGWNGGS